MAKQYKHRDVDFKTSIELNAKDLATCLDGVLEKMKTARDPDTYNRLGNLANYLRDKTMDFIEEIKE